MPSTVVGRFHIIPNAEEAIRELEQAGFSRGQISLIGVEDQWDESATEQALIGLHVPEDDAQDYVRAIDEGSAVLVIQTDDHDAAERALAVLNQTTALESLHKALSSTYDGPVDEPQIQAAHLRNTARTQDSVLLDASAKIYDTSDPVANAALSDFEEEWRQSFQHVFGDSGYRFEQLRPAYRYGGELALSRRFGEHCWADIERAVRRDWEQRNPSTWEQAREAIRCAWQGVRARIMAPAGVEPEHA